MKQISLLLGLILACASSISGAASLSNLNYLVGCWSVEDGGIKTVERWMRPGENVMLGLAQRTEAGDRVVEYEFLKVSKETDGSLTYSPYINGKNTVDFKYDEAQSSKAAPFKSVFANEAHDFPKKIVYSRAKLDEKEIHVRLEGTGEDGSPLVIEYPMFSEDCN